MLGLGLLPLTGCPVTPTPGPEAVLEGTWELTGEVVTEGVTNFLITFDEEGQITGLTYDYGVISVVVDDPSFIESVSSVNGSSVNISVTWLGVNNLVIDGTLSADQNTITGTATYLIVIGNLEISAPAGDATLTRQ
jgi:hypothetical protein